VANIAGVVKYNDNVTRLLDHFGGVRKKPLRNDEFCKAFGAHVRRLREESGISMRQFASNLNLEYNQIFLIETGKVNTSISMAQAIAGELGIPVADLFIFKFPPTTKN
jgi:DNA-binding XRE family transcriptional regulator